METSVNYKCRAFTSLEQSRKLAEILPIESADGGWYGTTNQKAPNTNFWLGLRYSKNAVYPAWSIAALLGVLPNGTNIIKDEADTENEKYMCTVGIKGNIMSTFGKNPIDACYEMILKLHEKLL